MRSSVTSTLVLAALVSGAVSLYGCSSTDDTGGGGSAGFPAFAGTTGTAGTPGASGSTSTAGTPGASGSTSTAGNGTGGAGTAGAGTGGNTMTTAGNGGMSTGGGSAGGSGGGSSGGGDITKVWKSDGCGKQYGMSGQKQNIGTMGTKDAQCADALNGQPKCGPWGQASSSWQKDPVPREFIVNLPQPYDPTKAYPLVFEGPGCGGGAANVYPLNNNINNTVIRVGLTPPPTYIGHGTNPGEGCFDDKEGDDSVDWVFYENLYDKLNTELCFDRNRVFSAGNSSGSWFSNELVCKYAGDMKRPVRGAMPNTGGLPTDPRWVPTCTNAKMAGMWIHEVGDTTNPFTGNKVAIARAMKVNGCTNMDYDAAVAANNVENFPIGGGVPDDTCKKIKGCPDLYPLVVCPLPGNAHGSHDTQANNGFSTFVKMFEGGAFLTQ